EFYETGRRLETEMHQRLLAIKAGLFSYASEELMKRKQLRKVHFYDDLLLLVRKALRGSARGRLVRSVSRKYRAALVDEFQDTDPIQYDIFSTLFSGKGKTLFMIGDPKQAIYGFRGADLFSYIKASEDAKKRYTLTQNYRSIPKLVSAVNRIFGNRRIPFLFEKIPFPPGRSPTSWEISEKSTEPPLKIWFLPGKKNALIPKGEALRIISRGVAIEIRSLIQDRQIEPKEIAILTRTHRQGRILKEVMAQYLIPAVLFSGESIFDSHEALEMERLLTGISEPANLFKIRAALVTDMVGFTADDLYPESGSDSALEDALARFREYHDSWRRDGFIPMFVRFLKQERVKQRLISFENGERRLTNLMHLSELLHQASDKYGFTMERLIQWLSENRNAALPRMEEDQLRLESDENAVSIVTVHKSKGLEYPVVFCPFSWEGPAESKGELTFHDPHGSAGKILDLNPDATPEHRLQARKEDLSETLRLLYVALTRAGKRCYLVWGRINGAQTSPILELLHGNPDAGSEKIPTDIFHEKTDDDLLKDLDRLAERSEGSIEIQKIPSQGGTASGLIRPDAPTWVLRSFSGRIPTEWKITSYSSLISRSPEDEEIPDTDFDFLFSEAGEPRREESLSFDSGEKEIFSFPKGARAGNFFHTLFETIDFSVSPHDQPDLISRILAEYGFDLNWKDTVAEAASRVLSAPLEGAFGKVILSKLPPNRRIHEMEFYYPLKRITPKELEAAFAGFGSSISGNRFSKQMGRLLFSPREGFMKGYVDLVAFQNNRVYILDWKTNDLGAGIHHYGKRDMDEAMEHSYYFLQYHLYVVAITRYLKLRNPSFDYNSDFGGVFYLFLRGIHPEVDQQAGIYYALPDPGQIEALENALIPGDG
ncbi:MAG: 3'-5' exonuclease, partial [Thermodesulfobacteriota bacterium]